MHIKKLLATAGVVALFAGAAVVTVAGPAAAAPSITVTPNSDLKAGDKIQVTLTGFTANAPVAVGVCPTGRDLKGAGDCGPSKQGGSKLLVADASGKVSATLTVIKGPLGNLTPPKATCPPCSVSAANISKATEKATVKLNYASASTTKTVTQSNKAKTETPKTKAEDTALPETGPRETLILAFVGLLVLQAGLIMAVRATRSAPRRSAL